MKRIRALACDFDGTLATHGSVGPATVAALRRFVESGRKLLMVTGRQLEELLALFPEVGLFERVVAENGALIYTPATQHQHLLAERFAESFVPVLEARGVQPVATGRVIVATWEPHEVTVLQTIHDLGLELQVIFNKGAVMVLPGGINKATGLVAALHELGLSAHNTAGVGDAENDHAFLAICECSAAVANALPVVKERADITTRGGHGEGVEELIEQILRDDLADLTPCLTRHYLRIGQRANGEDFKVPPCGGNLLLACPQTNGLPAAAAAFLHRLEEAGYQYCLIEMECPLPGAEHGVVLGTASRAPTGDEIVQALSDPTRQVVVVLAAIPAVARRKFVLLLLARLRQLREESSRPHWIVLNEAHQLLPRQTEHGGPEEAIPSEGTMLISSHPAALAATALDSIRMAIVADGASLAALDGEAVSHPAGLLPKLEPQDLLVWQRDNGQPPFSIRIGGAF